MPILRTSRLCLTPARLPRRGRKGKTPLWKWGKRPTGEKCVNEESVFWEKRCFELPFGFILGQVRLPIICREAILRFVNFISQGSKSLPKIEMCPHSGQRAKSTVAFMRTRVQTEGSGGLWFAQEGGGAWGVRWPPARSLGPRVQPAPRDISSTAHPHQEGAAEFPLQLQGRRGLQRQGAVPFFLGPSVWPLATKRPQELVPRGQPASQMQ